MFLLANQTNSRTCLGLKTFLIHQNET